MDIEEEGSTPEETVELTLEERAASLESVAEQLIQNHTRMSSQLRDLSKAIERITMIIAVMSEELEKQNAQP